MTIKELTADVIVDTVLSVSLKDGKALVSMTVSPDDENAFAAFSDDEKKVIRTAILRKVKQLINVQALALYKNNPLKAVSACFIPFTIPAPYGTGKPAIFSLACRQFLDAEKQSNYDTYALSMNRLFAWYAGRKPTEQAKVRKDIKYFLDQSFKLFTAENIRANEKDVDLLIQSSINVRAGKAQTFKENQVQGKIEFVLNSKVNNTPYLIELVSKTKDYNRIVPDAVEFKAPAKY